MTYIIQRIDGELPDPKTYNNKTRDDHIMVQLSLAMSLYGSYTGKVGFDPVTRLFYCRLYDFGPNITHECLYQRSAIEAIRRLTPIYVKRKEIM